MNKAIYFDMDGTITDLYGVENWLDCIIAENAMPYEIAKPLVNMNVLARTLNKLIKDGWTVNIISWLARDSKPDYDNKVIKAKRDWLKRHLASVQFTDVNIVPYGTKKALFAKADVNILFDDEERNRKEWNGTAYNVNNIIETLKALL